MYLHAVAVLVTALGVSIANAAPAQQGAKAAKVTVPKRGLVFNDPSTNIQHFDGSYGGNSSNIVWAYNWNSVTDSKFPTNLEYVPMLWSDLPVHTKIWNKNVNAAGLRGTTHLLSFNEPDGNWTGQANMTPQQAVDAYMFWMMPYAGIFKLGAPAVTNGPKGLPWLQKFLALCTACQIDFIPFHWYDAYWNTAYLRHYVNSTYIVGGGRPLWISELHASGTQDQQVAFMNYALPWLDAQPYVHRYAWYWTNYLVNTTTTYPNILGKTFGYTKTVVNTV